MTTAAQLEANRRNAQRSTGPRTAEGRARSAQNAVKHGFTGRLLVGLQYGPFADDAEDVQAFVQAVLEELQPRSAQEKAEALNIAGLYVRRSRMVELEAMALAHATRTPLLSPAAPGQPARIAQDDLTRAGANAFDSDLFDRLPRYEGHLGRELDRSLTRYARLQETRARALKRAAERRPPGTRRSADSVGAPGQGHRMRSAPVKALTARTLVSR